MLQPFKHNVVWAFLAPSNSTVQRFLWKNRENGIFEALFEQDNDIVQMRDMAHSICLIKLYQITMRKSFDFLFLTTLKQLSLSNSQNFYARRSNMAALNQCIFLEKIGSKKMIPIPPLFFHFIQAFGTARGLVIFIIKLKKCASVNFTKFLTPVIFDKAIWLL